MLDLDAVDNFGSPENVAEAAKKQFGALDNFEAEIDTWDDDDSLKYDRPTV